MLLAAANCSITEADKQQRAQIAYSKGRAGESKRIKKRVTFKEQPQVHYLPSNLMMMVPSVPVRACGANPPVQAGWVAAGWTKSTSFNLMVPKLSRTPDRHLPQKSHQISQQTLSPGRFIIPSL